MLNLCILSEKQNKIARISKDISELRYQLGSLVQIENELKENPTVLGTTIADDYLAITIENFAGKLPIHATVLLYGVKSMISDTKTLLEKRIAELKMTMVEKKDE